MKSYKHFTLEERESLYLLLKIGKNISEIARELKRSKSTISREIKRNKNQDGTYTAWGAYSKYRHRRKKCRRTTRIVPGSELYKFIEERLKKYWSPEIIAQKWNDENKTQKIYHSTIYLAIKRGIFKPISVSTHLRRRGRKKQSCRSKFNSIHPEHTIHERPQIANNRERFGDFEGDTIVGGRGKGCLVVFVDRKIRKLLVAKSMDMTSQSIYEATLKAFGNIRPKSITLDNGPEFAKFKEIENSLNTTIYFADPHSPWQRGTNENINDCLRFFFPKGCDFRSIDDSYIQFIVDLINNRPRKCLNFSSPNDFFLSLLHLD